MMIGIPPVSNLMGGYHILFLLWLGWVALFDLCYHRIPDSFSAVTAGAGIGFTALRAWQNGTILLPLADSLAGALLGGGLLLLVSLLSKGGFGGGDIKLMAGLGLFYGVIGTVSVLFIAVLTALFAGLFLRRKKKEYRLPFAPFLLLGCFAASLI